MGDGVPRKERSLSLDQPTMRLGSCGYEYLERMRAYPSSLTSIF